MDFDRREILGFFSSLLTAAAIPPPVQTALAAMAPVDGVPALDFFIQRRELLLAHDRGLFNRIHSGLAFSLAEIFDDTIAKDGFTAKDAAAFVAGRTSGTGFHVMNMLREVFEPYAGCRWREVLDIEGAKTFDASLHGFLSSFSLEDQIALMEKVRGYEIPPAIRQRLVKASPEQHARQMKQKENYLRALKRLGGLIAGEDHDALVGETLKKIALQKLAYVEDLLDHPERPSELHYNPWSLQSRLESEPGLKGTRGLHHVRQRLKPHIEALEEARFASYPPRDADDTFERGLYDALRAAHEAYGARVFIDAPMPPGLAEILPEYGFDLRCAEEFFTPSAELEDRARYAMAAGRVLVTQDKDVLTEARFPLASLHGVIVLPKAEDKTGRGYALFRIAVDDLLRRAPRTPCGWIGKGFRYRSDGLMEIHGLLEGGRRGITLRRYIAPVLEP